MTPLYINNKSLYEIFSPDTFDPSWSESVLAEKSAKMHMLPTEAFLVSETYSRDADRTADYELEELTIVNRKAKPEFTWDYLKADYVKNLMLFLGYTYNFFDDEGVIVPVEAEPIVVKYWDFLGFRTIKAYMGQTVEGTLVEYQGTLYWQNFRIAFPER